MELNNIAVVGLGQCGCRIADGFKRTFGELTPIYINSSESDLLDCAYVNQYNKHIFSGSDGSGKDIDKALKLVVNDEARLLSFLDKYTHLKYMLVVAALGGGTGAGTIAQVSRTIKENYPGTKVSVLGILPKKSEGKVSIENAVRVLRELSSNNFINTVDNVVIADNNNVNSDVYGEINYQIIQGMGQAFELTTESKSDRIDKTDLKKVFCDSKGYLSIISMPNHASKFEDALVEAKAKSVFIPASTMECTYGAAVLNKKYDLTDPKVLISADEVLFASHDDGNSDKNMILLGGCSFPVEVIQEFEQELLALKRNRKQRSLGVDYKLCEDRRKTINDETQDTTIKTDAKRRRRNPVTINDL